MQRSSLFKFKVVCVDAESFSNCEVFIAARQALSTKQQTVTDTDRIINL